MDKIRQQYDDVDNVDDDDVDDDDDDQDLRLHESIALSFQAGPKKAAQGVADLLMIMMMVMVVVVVVDNINIRICPKGG